MSIVLSAFSSILLARMLGPEAQGKWSLSNNFISTCTMIFAFGLPSSVLSTFRRSGLDEHQFMKSLLRYFLLIIILSAFLLCVFYFMPNWQFLTSDLIRKKWMLPAFLFSMGCQTAMSILYPILDAKNRFGLVTFNKLFGNLLFLLLIIFLLYFSESTVQLIWIWIIFCFIQLIQVLIIFYHLVFTVSFQPGNKTISVAQLIVKSGWVYFMIDIFQRFNFRLDIWFLSYYKDLNQVGIYSVASSLSLFVLVKPRTSQRFLINSMIVNHDQENRKRVKAEITKILMTLLSIFPVILIFSYVLFYYILGNKYHESFFIFLCLLFGIYILSVTYPISGYFLFKGYKYCNLLASMAGLVINFIGNYVWIPAFGIWGAVFSSIFTYSAISMVLAFCFIKTKD